MLRNLLDRERFLHSIKTAIACFIGFLVTKLIGFPADQWILITILIIMCAQIYVGSVVQKAYLRFLGTIVGCLFATITIITVKQSNLATLLTICFSGFIFSYIATLREDLSYACTLGAATTAIILLSQKPTIFVAGVRFMEISIGLLIATLVSQFVFPIHARDHLRRAQVNALELLRNHYTACMIKNEVDYETKQYEESDENIVKTLSKQRQLAKEATREPLGESFNSKMFVKSLRCEKEILRAINFMHKALLNIHKTKSPILQSKSLKSFHENVLQAFNVLISKEEKGVKLNLILPEVQALKNEIENIPIVTREEFVSVYGFLFTAEILINSLKEIAILYRVTIVKA